MTREISLGFGWEQYFMLVVSGVFGALPTCTWLVMLTLPLELDHTRFPPLVGVISAIVMVFMMLVAPWLAAVLVLRARQPLAARIEWNEDVVIEWDGDEKRTVIPWRAAVAHEREWVVQYKRGPRTERALQVFDPNTKNTISVWSTRPNDVPPIRRKIASDGVSKFRTAIVTHGLRFTGEPEWSRAFEPSRPPHPRWFLLSRFGYPAAVLAPLLLPQNVVLGLGVTALAALLLTIRAWPVFRELRRSPRNPRAVRAEAFFRGTFVVLVIYSAWASWAFLNPD